MQKVNFIVFESTCSLNWALTTLGTVQVVINPNVDQMDSLVVFRWKTHVCIIVAYMLQQIKPSARVNQRNLGVDSSLEESSGREAGDGAQRSKPAVAPGCEGEVSGWKLEGGSPGRRSLWWLAREGCWCVLHSVNSGSVLNAVSFRLHNIPVIVTDYIRFRINGESVT